MALKAESFHLDPFDFICDDPYSYEAGSFAYDLNLHEDDVKSLLDILENKNHLVDQGCRISDSSSPEEEPPAARLCGRKRRRRAKSTKNEEEIHNQRMTHIAVERNRRRLMNEYLAVIRSLMPPSYAQRGDQASIIGGAINFVKELEQVLQSVDGERKVEQQNDAVPEQGENVSNRSTAAGDVEVTMVESHCNVKILTKRRARQLVKIVRGLEVLGLSIQHLSVTTVDQMVLHSISVKVEDGCNMSSADEIAVALNGMIRRIEDEGGCSAT